MIEKTHESNNNKYEERLFFFRSFNNWFLSNLPSTSPYLYIRTIGSMTIEFGELLAYLFLLKNSPSVFIVSFILFSIEVL
ncbi:unnamed protein product, partial [Rotaria sp. Silwood1]